MCLGFFLIARDIHPDLSDGHPRAADPSDPVIPLGWPSLRLEAAGPLPKNGAMVRMLGYMMDGYEFARPRSSVRMFVLMPGAGHFLHPAHRVPDEMVDVWPRAGMVFQDRELVWASGKFQRLTYSAEDHARYALREATVNPASERDIAGWFAP
jgi:hypothetical protein